MKWKYLIVIILVLFIGIYFYYNSGVFFGTDNDSDKSGIFNPLKESQRCDDISEAYDRDNCWRKEAEQGQIDTPEICEQIENRDIKDYCFDTLAIKKLDASLCERIVESLDRRYSCYIEIAKQKKDDSLCEKASDTFRDSCYIEIAKQKKDDSLCEKVSTKDLLYGWNNRNTCYNYLAVEKKDILLCEKITHPQQKGSCIGSFE